MKTCWTCRRRRLICDGASPRCKKCELRGVECDGYTKPLTWVAGAASRGRMSGRTFGISDSPGSTAVRPLHDVKQTKGGAGAEAEECRALIASNNGIAKPLTEPIFQDLSYDSRYFIDYFERLMCRFLVLNDSQRNPYRALIPLIASSKGVLNAIMSIAVCHLIHSTTGLPVFSSLQPRSLQGGQEKKSLVLAGSSNPSLLQYLLLFKQRSLRSLSEALSHSAERISSSTLATAVLLVALDIWEGGSGPWNYHLEGAKRLIEVGVGNGSFDPDGELGTLVHGLAMLETFGSTLLRPGVLTRPLRLHIGTAPYHETPDITMVGCPHDIASAIDTVTSERQNCTLGLSIPSLYDTTSPSPPVTTIERTLLLIDAFDVYSWAHNTIASSPTSSVFPSQILAQMATVWKLSATLYATRIHLHLTQQRGTLDHLVDSMIAEYALIGHNDDVLKCLLWPVFIAGAESNTLEQKTWALGTLDKIWHITLSANSRKAAMVLTQYWENRKGGGTGVVGAGHGEQNWFEEFELLSDRLLIF